jgi:hypothetical protein
LAKVVKTFRRWDKISELGETLSYGRQSQAGNAKTLMFGAKNGKELMICIIAASSRATWINDLDSSA